ncbi:MAG: B12-binding domain-containing radical SAM protein [Thermodesulfobacteriota bacterium]
MRVLLISSNTEQFTMPVLPMGLAGVAAALKQAGHEVSLLNLMIQDDSHQLIKEAIQDFKPELIGISVRNIDDQSRENPRFLLEPVREVVTSCRAFSRAPIVVGGAGYSIFPQAALHYLGADMGIRGEGEAALISLIDRLQRHADITEVPGLFLPHRGAKKPAEVIKNLDEFPLPGPEQISLPPAWKGQQIWVPLQTRRGCPMQCSYCSTLAIEGKMLRRRSPDLVVEAISRFVAAGFTHFYFVDNTFNLPPAYAKELCDRLSARHLDIKWRCILYPWKVDEELVEKMARAGCLEVALGFESGSPKILQSLGKKFLPEEVHRIAKLLHKHGIQRMGFLMFGAPGETRDTVRESLAFADSLNLEAMKITTGIRIYPDTLLARTALQEGVITPATNLLFPTFYLASGLEPWLSETVASWLQTHPHWHG